MPKNFGGAERRALWAAEKRPTVRRQHVSREISREPNQRRGSRSLILKILLATVVVTIASGGIFGYRIIAASDSISDTNRSILGQLKDLLFTSGRTLSGEDDGRINILLIAVGGAGHKGEDLADTIMVASLKPATNEAALLSIPRDLYVQVPSEEYFTKINAVHAYGESQKEGGGPPLLRQLTEEITGVPIHYYIRVDFTAFKGIVDAVGGVNINIENTFYDYWHKISFPAGTEKMKGERALAFVRARYIEGPEGGDFRRAGRQQQVLLALRQKVFSVQTALDFTRANAILNSLSENIRTDMQLWEMRRFYELARLIEPDKVSSAVLTSGPQGVLTGGTELLGGQPASVLKPRTGDYSEIRQIAQNIFDVGSSELADTPTVIEQPPAQDIEPELAPTPKPSLEIRNGTTITGLAGRTRDALAGDDYQITGVGNAVSRDVTTTSVYIIDTDHEQGANEIAATLNANIKNSLPEDEPSSSADVLIILGSDAE